MVFLNCPVMHLAKLLLGISSQISNKGVVELVYAKDFWDGYRELGVVFVVIAVPSVVRKSVSLLFRVVLVVVSASWAIFAGSPKPIFGLILT